ncbi:MAG TPA: hypothetical protein PKX92_06875 [Edaphocola sp.]|nr:hypothetical protein [Edaphocola sp.]
MKYLFIATSFYFLANSTFSLEFKWTAFVLLIILAIQQYIFDKKKIIINPKYKKINAYVLVSSVMITLILSLVHIYRG